MYGKTICSVYTWYIPRTTTLFLYTLVCICTVHGINLSVHGSSLFILFHTLKMQKPFSEHAKPFSGEYICSTYLPEPPTYNASVQESAFLYIPCSYRYIHPKNGSGRWSAFLGHFCKNVSGSVSHCLNHAE